MIAVYYILKALNLTQTLTSLVLVYSAGAALGFYIAKGFFDTIPYSLDESAMIDEQLVFKSSLRLPCHFLNQSSSTLPSWPSWDLG